MSAQIIFLTVFLGLTSGKHAIEVRADPIVQAVAFLLDGREVARIDHTPWTTEIDFGTTLVPRELTAVGYNGTVEVARTSQILNLPKPPAELAIVVTRDEKGEPSGAELCFWHRQESPVKKLTLQLDGSELEIDAQRRAKFPPLDVTRPHFLSAEALFEDGHVARKESVFGGVLPEMMPAELTPTLVRRTKAPQGAFVNCFAARGDVVRTAAVEKPGAIVILVRDPDLADATFTLYRAGRNRWFSTAAAMQHELSLDKQTSMQIVWPVSRRYQTAGSAPMELFDNSTVISSTEAGLMWTITRASVDDENRPRRYAEAVAVAGVSALAGARRRAVVLILGEHDREDKSGYEPPIVRRYLESIGVPLFVWTLTRSRLMSAWGTAEDISTPDRLAAATSRLRGELESQRVAWIDADAVTALHVDAREECGYTPVAH